MRLGHLGRMNIEYTKTQSREKAILNVKRSFGDSFNSSFLRNGKRFAIMRVQKE